MPYSPTRPFGSFVLAVVAVVAGIVGLTASAGLVDVMPLAWIVAAAAAALAVRRVLRPDARAVIDAAPRGYRLAFGAGAALLLVQLVPSTMFIIDPTIATWRPSPLRPMPSQHACSTAYWTACDAAARGGRIYDEDLSSVAQADPTRPRVPRSLGVVSIDPYEYPPSFLPLPELLRQVTGDYWGFRRLWFALTLAVVVGMAVLVARRLDRRMQTHAVWLTPYLLAAPNMVATLLMGNVQLATIAAALGAMLLFERGRFAAGGLVLGCVASGKLYPGLLVVYLVFRREWRAAGWTLAWSAAFALVSVVLYGTTPWIEFLHELPRLLSGEAFSAFRNPNAIANNQSVPGLVFKLKLVGVPYMDFATMRVVGWLYTAAILAATAWLALRARPQGREPLVWLVILFLATMRSPFLPTYAAFPTLWLATLVLSGSAGRPGVFRATVAILAVVSISMGIGFLPPLVSASWTTAQTLAAFALAAITCASLRAPSTAPARVQATPGMVSA
jgi:hypothetical protein